MELFGLRFFTTVVTEITEREIVTGLFCTALVVLLTSRNRVQRLRKRS